MTPLIDVIFLLLMFFMLSSTFSTYGEIELNPAVGGATATSPPPARAFLQLGAERLVLNGVAVTLDTLDAKLEAGQLLISLDADTSAQRLVDLLLPLRKRDGLTVTVLE